MSWFQLTLDTTAPHITWGAVEGADAGETLIVHWTSDEPVVSASATLTLPNGAVLDMAVGADTFTVDVPGDSYQGTAEVRALVEDDVGNVATRVFEFAIGGVIPPTPVVQQTTGGIPRGPIAPRVVRDRSGAGISSVYRARAHTSSRSRARAASHYTTPTDRLVRTRAGASASSLITNHEVRIMDRGSTRAAAREDLILRREGPDHQAELILLDIL